MKGRITVKESLWGTLRKVVVISREVVYKTECKVEACRSSGRRKNVTLEKLKSLTEQVEIYLPQPYYSNLLRSKLREVVNERYFGTCSFNELETHLKGETFYP